MEKNHFIIFAPPISISTKEEIYTPFSRFSTMHGPYVKAITDCFFLSNKFRSNRIVHFCTKIKNNDYIITFKGTELRYLGPSFFSASNLILRAINHILNPRSKKGKLTPGLTIKKIEENALEYIQQKYKGKRIIIITNAKEKKMEKMEKMLHSENVFIFGEIEKEKQWEEISFGELEIDEQMILLNYHLDVREKNECA